VGGPVSLNSLRKIRLRARKVLTHHVIGDEEFGYLKKWGGLGRGAEGRRENT